MEFTTAIPISSSSYPIEYSSNILSLGSCFAENIGEKCNYFKFRTVVNPFGIIFNAVSIEKLIHRAIHKIEFTENDIFFHNELWHCFEVHSEHSDYSKDSLLQKLNTTLHQFRIQLQEATHIILTYGTSWVYRNKASNDIVANCHKVPQNQFEKELLSIETIENSIKKTIEFTQTINPNCHFIFTISPVRHIKDGFVENQLSKSYLIASLQSVVNTEHYKRNTDYFPSYEIMMDELRDYRFYAQDMIHPNQTAIDYIWKRFSEKCISPDCSEIMEQVLGIQKALKHKPFNPNSESHKQFLIQLKNRIAILKEKNPAISF